MGPEFGPRAQICFGFFGARGGPPHLIPDIFQKLGSDKISNFFAEDFPSKLTSHMIIGGEPLIKALQEGHTNLPKPLRTSSHVPKNQNFLPNFQKFAFFFGTFLALQLHNPGEQP